MKRFLKQLERQGFRFFCVGCRRERLLSIPARVGSFKFFAQILVTTAFFTVLGWPWMSFKGAFVFLIPVGLVFEAYYRMRMRAALVCPDCSFDPILYLVDRQKAIKEVENAWRTRLEQKGIPYPDEKERVFNRVRKQKREISMDPRSRP